MPDVLTLAEAAKALRLRRGTATSWLRAQGLVVLIGGQERVYWPAVAAKLQQPASTPAGPPTADLPRAGLVRSQPHQDPRRR